MAEIILQAENLGKRYRLGTGQSLARKLKAVLKGQFAKVTEPRPEEFWALRDVSFAIERGQIVGLIGRNGAGKSTLLKILSRITAPTTGRVQITGRISSLLEVGTGFQPDLTGRENIFLNGSILGMHKAEIVRKFDEIVAFAELQKFVDTPVKRYSSGMYMRLAFAVAAHLDPDILILDEVLAVGDSAFHRKCLGKMGQVAGEGRTVLMVSHNLPSILSLCDRCLFLEQGRLVRDGPTTQVAVEYESRMAQGEASTFQEVGRIGSGKARITQTQIHSTTETGEQVSYLKCGQDLWVTVNVTAHEDVSDCVVSMSIHSSTNEQVIDANISTHGKLLSLHAGQKARVVFHLRDVLLKPDVYRIETWLGRPKIEAHDWIKLAGSFSVEPEVVENPLTQYSPGVYRCRFSEEVQLVD